MVVKLVGVIFALSLVELADVIFALLINRSAGKYHPRTIINMLCIGGKAGRYYPCSINRNTSRYHLCITIKATCKEKMA